jgi:hypothetical protein
MNTIIQKAGLALAVIMLGGASAACAQQLRPLSMEDKARVDALLRSFDPNSYAFTYSYVGPGNRVQTAQAGQAKGLASLRQSETVRRLGRASAGTNNNINIFREVAGTNNNINIFREAAAGTNNNINIFRDATLNSRARELNLILQKYYTPSAQELEVAREPQLRPLSMEDKARVDALLRSFDPNSYAFTYSYVGPGNRVQTAQAGQAKGLASLRQSETVRRLGRASAGTNNNINIFREVAGTNNNINIFREAAAGTNNNINIFRDATLNSRARELNLILQKYYTPGAQ